MYEMHGCDITNDSEYISVFWWFAYVYSYFTLLHYINNQLFCKGYYCIIVIIIIIVVVVVVVVVVVIL